MPAKIDFRDALGTLHAPAQGEPRIVSLVPSLTELLCDLDSSLFHDAAFVL